MPKSESGGLLVAFGHMDLVSDVACAFLLEEELHRLDPINSESILSLLKSCLTCPNLGIC